MNWRPQLELVTECLRVGHYLIPVAAGYGYKYMDIDKDYLVELGLLFTHILQNMGWCSLVLDMIYQKTIYTPHVWLLNVLTLFRYILSLSKKV